MATAFSFLLKVIAAVAASTSPVLTATIGRVRSTKSVRTTRMNFSSTRAITIGTSAAAVPAGTRCVLWCVREFKVHPCPPPKKIEQRTGKNAKNKNDRKF